MSEPAPGAASFDPEQIVTVLARHGVRYVLVGALAARLQGFPRLTADADITPARDVANLERLAAALRELRARVYTEGSPDGLAFDISAEALARTELWNLVTSAGRLDIVFEPAGTRGYQDIKRSALRYQVFGVKLDAAALRDIVRSKKATGRPQDRQDVAVMLAMLRKRPKPEKDRG